jgi:hypothetical protein
LLIAGRNEVNFTPVLDRAARAWNVRRVGNWRGGVS